LLLDGRLDLLPANGDTGENPLDPRNMLIWHSAAITHEAAVSPSLSLVRVARFDAPQVAFVDGQQVLEFAEQLFGNIRRTPELAKVRNNSPLRFNVALAVRYMTLRHFQGGLPVHVNGSTLKRRAWRLLFGPRRSLLSPVAP